MLYASDAPFGAEGGASYIRETMKVIASLEIPQADMEKILLSKCADAVQAVLGALLAASAGSDKLTV